MTDLERFVRDRLEEDRVVAQAAIDDPFGSDDCWFDTSNEHIGDHYRRHSPERVIADVEAKRELLELYDIASKDGFGGSEGWVLIRDAVYALAALWSDHEDYDPTWRTQ